MFEYNQILIYCCLYNVSDYHVSINEAKERLDPSANGITYTLKEKNPVVLTISELQWFKCTHCHSPLFPEWELFWNTVSLGGLKAGHKILEMNDGWDRGLEI